MSNKIDRMLNEFAGEITKQNTITVKDGNNDVRYFTFDTTKLKLLDRELNKAYGDKIVKAIMKEINKAIEGGYLKQFANDRSVDFIVKDGELKSVFRQSNGTVSEGAEFDGKTWSGNFSKELLGKLAAYVNKNYGLDTIAQKDSIADIAYDAAKRVYIITFEPTAKDRNGKTLTTTSIDQGIINNFPLTIPTPGVK